MKKLTALLCVCLFGLLAQAQISSTSVTLNKIAQPAMKLDLPIDDDVTEDFFVQNLKKAGNDQSRKEMFSKSNKIDEGFYAIKDVRLQGTREVVDLYVKMEQKGKKSNHESTLTMLISKEGGFITSSSDKATYSAAENFLVAFINQAEAYRLQKAIEEQEDVVKDAEKKLDRQQKDQKDIEKRIYNLQEDLKDNKNQQADQEKTVDREKKKLEELKSQTKKYS